MRSAKRHLGIDSEVPFLAGMAEWLNYKVEELYEKYRAWDDTTEWIFVLDYITTTTVLHKSPTTVCTILTSETSQSITDRSLHCVLRSSLGRARTRRCDGARFSPENLRAPDFRGS